MALDMKVSDLIKTKPEPTVGGTKPVEIGDGMAPDNRDIQKLIFYYSKCAKISYTKVSAKLAQANSADTDQTAPLV